MPDPSPDPSLTEPEALFAAWLARSQASGEAADLEALCRAHPTHAALFNELHRDFTRLRSILEHAGFGLSEAPPRSLAERLRAQYGPEIDASPALGDKEPDASIPASSELLKRLTGHARSRYQLKGEIARGGMGAILRVWDEDLHRSLAMKVILGQGEGAAKGETPPIDRRMLARFLEEAQVTGQLDHPGIVPVHELGLDAEGRVYFTMKLVKGRDLRDILALVFEEREGWNETRALSVMLKVCEAMAYAHKKGVIHRDLKPANVMVGDFGEVFVMDWGLARVIGRKDAHDVRLAPEARTSTSLRTERAAERHEAPDSPLLTMDGDVVGTPAYMPPEQARGEVEKLDPRADVYAIGAMLYHLLARQMPYAPAGARISNRTVLGLVVNGPPASLSSLRKDVPAELVAICERAMAREAEQRYRDTLELAEDLRAYLERRVVKAYETGAIAELKKWVARNRGLASSLAAAVALLAAGVFGTSTFAVRADQLKKEAIAREERATARSNAVWAIQELKRFQTLDDDLEYAKTQDRPAYVWWLEQAHELVDGRPADPARGLRVKPGLADHRKLLAEIKAEESRPNEKRWWNEQLAELERDLIELLDRIVLAEKSVSSPRAKRAWADAIAAIGASPTYKGLRLTPQIDLIPTGPDPDSGLWEFAHLLTGEPAERGEDGEIELRHEAGLVFVLLPGGQVPIEDGKQPTPINLVHLDPFFISKYEMTKEQWGRIYLDPRSLHGESKKLEEKILDSILILPVGLISWEDCRAAIERIGAWAEMPTEAQWEYACRGGTTTRWWTGATKESLYSAANLMWEKDEPREYERGYPKPIGSLLANPFGLHDVHGNQAEWCIDAVGKDDDPAREGDGLRERAHTRYRVSRGGSSDDDVQTAASGAGSFGSHESGTRTDGIRPVRGITP